jgi:hypothetical protein
VVNFDDEGFKILNEILLENKKIEILNLKGIYFITFKNSKQMRYQ